MLLSVDLSTLRRVTGPASGTAFGLTVLVILLFPLVGLPREDERASLPPELSYLYAADIALIALALLVTPRLVGAVRRARDVEGVSWLALFALIGLAFAVHPSAPGVDVVLRLVAAAALYRVVVELDERERRLVAAALGLTAIVQAVIAAVQISAGSPLGLRMLGEMREPLSEYGGHPLARGTLGSEFILAALALVSATVLMAHGVRAARPAVWLISTSLAISSAGLVYGRTVAIALGLAFGSLLRAAARDRRHRWALAALILGAGIPAAIASEGWASSFARGVATDRGSMVAQALAIIEDQPVVGVGPGRYLETLRARPELLVTRGPQPVHNVPLMIAAEAGVPAGVLAAALLILIGWGALRAGAPALTLYVAYVPWMLVDVLPYVTPQGMVLTALWLGFLHRALARR